MSDELLYYKRTDPYTGGFNSYDESLVWMVGSLYAKTQLVEKNRTDEMITYDVKVTFHDRFDFSSGTGSVPKEIASLIGSFLFREFDWEATVNFQLEVPNTNSEFNGNYYFQFNQNTQELMSIEGGEFTFNDSRKIVKKNEDYYFLLNQPIRLNHDDSWVLEYTLNHVKYFVLFTVDARIGKYPYYIHYGPSRNYVFFRYSYYDDSGYVYDSYGTFIKEHMSYHNTNTYTFTLSNRMNDDGSNMIYFDVYNEDLEIYEIQNLPFTEYAKFIDGVYQPSEITSDRLSGDDFIINYIGTYNCPFKVESFEMKVWEKGKGLLGDENLLFVFGKRKHHMCGVVFPRKLFLRRHGRVFQRLL